MMMRVHLHVLVCCSCCPRIELVSWRCCCKPGLMCGLRFGLGLRRDHVEDVRSEECSGERRSAKKYTRWYTTYSYLVRTSYDMI